MSCLIGPGGQQPSHARVVLSLLARNTCYLFVYALSARGACACVH